MKFKDLSFLVWYSIKDILLDIFRFLAALKKPKTWSFILYATFFLMLYYRKLTKTNAIIIIALLLLIYVILQHKDPEFTRAVKEKAFLHDEEEKIKKYYEAYKKQCYFSIPKKEPREYEEWKKKEQERIRKEKEATQSA